LFLGACRRITFSIRLGKRRLRERAFQLALGEHFMYSLLLEGTTQFLVSFWVMLVSILACLFIFLLATVTHRGKNRTARKMQEKEKIYSNLIKTVRSGLSSDAEIKQAVPSQDYQYFQRYLQQTISTVEEINVSAEREIAQISGFTDHLKKRINQSTKWEKTIAVRVLSYFRDKQNLPLFRKIQAEDSRKETVFAASLGIALCKDPSSFRTIGYRLWELSGYNQEALLYIFAVQGEPMAPVIYEILCEEQIRDDAKVVIVKFLGEIGYQQARQTIANMLSSETSSQVLSACLYALRYLGDQTIVEKVIPFLHHEDFNIRIKALHAIGRASGIAFLKDIEKGLEDKNWWVRREAALAMAELGGEGITRLQTIAHQEHENSRFAARGILAELKYNRITVKGF